MFEASRPVPDKAPDAEESPPPPFVFEERKPEAEPAVPPKTISSPGFAPRKDLSFLQPDKTTAEIAAIKRNSAERRAISPPP